MSNTLFYNLLKQAYYSGVYKLYGYNLQAVVTLNQVCKDPNRCISLVANCEMGEGKLVDQSVIQELTPIYLQIVKYVCLVRGGAEIDPKIVALMWDGFKSDHSACAELITPGLDVLSGLYRGFVKHYEGYCEGVLEQLSDPNLEPNVFCQVHNNLVKDMQFGFDPNTYTWSFTAMQYDLTATMQDILDLCNV